MVNEFLNLPANLKIYIIISAFFIILYFYIAFRVFRTTRTSLSWKFIYFCINLALYNITVLSFFLVSNIFWSKVAMFFHIVFGMLVPVFWYMFLRKTADTEYRPKENRWKKVLSNFWQQGILKIIKKRELWSSLKHTFDLYLFTYLLISFIGIFYFLYKHFISSQSEFAKYYEYWYYSTDDLLTNRPLIAFCVFFIFVIGHGVKKLRDASRASENTMQARFFRELSYISIICAFFGIADVLYLCNNIGLFPLTPVFGIYYLCFIFNALVQYRLISTEWHAETLGNFFQGMVLMVIFLFFSESILSPLITILGKKFDIHIPGWTIYAICAVVVVFSIYLLRPKKLKKTILDVSSLKETFFNPPELDDLRRSIIHAMESYFNGQVRIILKDNLSFDDDNIKNLLQSTSSIKICNDQQQAEPKDAVIRQDCITHEANFKTNSFKIFKNFIKILNKKIEENKEKYYYLDKTKLEERIRRPDKAEIKENRKLLDGLKLLNAEFCFPIKRSMILRGLIIIGKKKSSNPFSLREIAVLNAFVALSTIAIEYAFVTERQRNQITGFSHDLKTPLTPIRICSEILTKEDVDISKKKKAQDILTIEIDRYENMISNLIDAVEIDTKGSISKRPSEPFSLQTIVESVIGLYEPYLKKQDIQIEFENQNCLAQCLGRADEIKRVIINLLDNCRKYAQGSKVKIKLFDQKRFCVFQIEDSGPGIKPELFNNIFERKFLKHDSTQQGQNHGLGIGLYISKKIIEEHRGFMDVDSIENRGTKFCFGLPY